MCQRASLPLAEALSEALWGKEIGSAIFHLDGGPLLDADALGEIYTTDGLIGVDGADRLESDQWVKYREVAQKTDVPIFELQPGYAYGPSEMVLSRYFPPGHTQAWHGYKSPLSAAEWIRDQLLEVEVDTSPNLGGLAIEFEVPETVTDEAALKLFDDYLTRLNKLYRASGGSGLRIVPPSEILEPSRVKVGLGS